MVASCNDQDFSSTELRPFLLGLLSAFDNRYQACADKFFQEITWKQFFAIICINLCEGAPTLNELSDIMGTVLLVLAVYFIFFSSKVHLKAGIVTGLAAGAVSGFCGGLFNIGGPPMVAYFLSVTQDKEKYNATLQMFFTINTASIFLIHFFQGHVSEAMVPVLLAALAGTAAGTVGGMALFRRLTMEGIRKVIYAFMVCAGAYLLLT